MKEAVEGETNLQTNAVIEPINMIGTALIYEQLEPKKDSPAQSHLPIALVGSTSTYVDIASQPKPTKIV